MDIAERSQRAAASLSRYLQPLTFADWSAGEVTAEIARWVLAWGVDHGWRVRREVPGIAGLSGAHADRPGHFDVVCERLDGPPIAVEIGPADGQWSDRKLLCEVGTGAVAVRVRWGSDEMWSVPAPVEVVRLSTTRHNIDGRVLYSRTMSATADVPRSAPPDDRAAPSPRSRAAKPTPCRAHTNKGQPCPINARASGLCHVHDPDVQCRAITKRGKRCAVATGGGRCPAHRDTPSRNPAPTLL